ncbi:MAG: ankyrin repeat domain-containing protein [Bryobacteraceae bacterium]
MKRNLFLAIGVFAVGLLPAAAVAAEAKSDARANDSWTPLMNAAAYGSAAEVKSLLDHGADPHAKNASGATALHFAVMDEAKVRALLNKGADVNVTTRQGRTPLQAAAAIDGGANVVRLLLDKGADVNATATKDPGFPSPNPHGATALIEAARLFNPETTKLLLSRGAKPDIGDPMGTTPLMAAALHGRIENARILLDAGADVNKISNLKVSPVLCAAIRGDAKLAKLLIDRGADPKAIDFSGSTTLMWAAASDEGNPELVSLLLAKGVDPAVKNQMGETALDWAKKRNHSEVIDLLAKPATDLRAAVTKGLEATLASGPVLIQKSGCLSCHHNSLPLRAAALAKEKAIVVNPESVEKQTKTALGMWRGGKELLLQGLEGIPDLPMTGGYTLDWFAQAKMPADATTDALTRAIAIRQGEDGRWVAWSPRPPLETGDIHATAMGVRALTTYAPAGLREEYAKRVARARAWMLKATVVSTDERVWQLQGLAWAGAGASELAAFRTAVLADQRPDGGWGQMATLDTDAYETGRALMALRGAGVPVTDAAFQRGIRYLLRTQGEDGTWHVKSRSFPFQPLVDSGFPHGRDQWISAAGTSWALIALATAIPGA